MKVKEIISELKTADPEADVSFQMGDGCCGDTETLDGAEVEVMKLAHHGQDWVRFCFNAPWFLASCRKAGAAKRAVQDIIDSNKKFQADQEKKALGITPTIKDHVKGTVKFELYRDGMLFYRTSETNFLFPVPIEDIGHATFLAEDKAMLFMRYIRKFMEVTKK